MFTDFRLNWQFENIWFLIFDTEYVKMAIFFE